MSKLTKMVEGFFRVITPVREHNSGESLTRTTNLSLDSTERIRQIIRHELVRQDDALYVGTFEEEDDFDFDDGETWNSPYEEVFEPQDMGPARSAGVGRSPTETAPPAPRQGEAQGQSAHPQGEPRPTTPSPADPYGK